MGKQKHIVYKYVLGNEILYIGKSDAGFSRIHAHGKRGDNIPMSAWSDLNSSDIYFAEMADSHMADVYESELIRRYKPRLNKAKTQDWAGLPLPEPCWHLFHSHGKGDDYWKKSYMSLKDDYEKLYKAFASQKAQIEKLEEDLEEVSVSEDYVRYQYSGIEEENEKLIKENDKLFRYLKRTVEDILTKEQKKRFAEEILDEPSETK